VNLHKQLKAMDSDEDGEPDLVLTGFLFGNIDKHGRLENDFLDPESKRNLHQLNHLGIGRMWEEITGDAEADSQDGDSAGGGQDESSQSDEERTEAEGEESKPETGSEPKPEDSALMPPPPGEGEGDGSAQSGNKRNLDTPLAAMLPSKYADLDVTELFPEFRPGQVLRFSRLFGPGKPSSLPQIWRGVRKRKKKKQQVPSDVDGTSQDGTAKGADPWRLDLASPPPPELCEPDDELRLLRPQEEQSLGNKNEASRCSDVSPQVADWRYGPAQLWYDMYGIPETGDTFDYGFKCIMDRDQYPHTMQLKDLEEFPDDAYLMVSQLAWEEDVIWNGDDIKHKVGGTTGAFLSGTLALLIKCIYGIKLMALKSLRIATFAPNVAMARSHKSKGGGYFTKYLLDQGAVTESVAPLDERDDTWYSIFPVENEELVYGCWEDEVIWDAQAMVKKPEPQILTLDPNDENIILGVPDDPDPNSLTNTEPLFNSIRKDMVRKSRILLGKAGVIAEPEPPSPPPAQNMEKDPYNISNDEFYNPKLTQDSALKPNVGGNLIQHSIPAIELRAPFFPTHMGPLKLRSFHRPTLKRYSHGALAQPGPHGVIPLLKHIKKKAKMREQERQASGGGEMFFMRTAEDLTGRDGDIILSEYSEEHPPLIMQVGMATKIKNYYKRRPGKDSGAPEYKYGETAYAHTSPFLGSLAPGQSLQAFENNLFRAPIYEHNLPDTDFLVIRTRQHYYIREVETIYTVGQELPLFEVPGPNSKRANNFVRDFLQVFIYRLFWKSTDSPRRIKMEDIKKAFPSHSESSIRKRLKLCADFKRTGMDSNWWVLKPEFRLPTEDEIRTMVSPEQCCAYYSMISAEQRLKDAGYGEKSLFAPEDENDEEMQVKMDDEVKAAPWNTTRAFISSVKGKCLLQLTGVADPTSCGEGFSYVRVPNKPQHSSYRMARRPSCKRGKSNQLFTKLHLLNKYLLSEFYSEELIKKLSRWEVIDVVRTLSTEQAKAGEEGRFGHLFTFSSLGLMSALTKPVTRATRCFDYLPEAVTVGTISVCRTGGRWQPAAREENGDRNGRRPSAPVAQQRQAAAEELSHEREEAERRELQRLIMGEDSCAGDDKKKKDKGDSSLLGSLCFARSLALLTRRRRSGRSVEGLSFQPPSCLHCTLELLLHLPFTRAGRLILSQFVMALSLNRSRRWCVPCRIQEQLRRLKRNAEKEKHLPMRKKPKKEQPQLKLKCGACGAIGHMRTNKTCPQYQPMAPLPPVQVAMTEEQEEEEEGCGLPDDNLVKVDETRVVLSKQLIQHADEIRRKSLVLKFPKEAMALKKRRRAGTVLHCDYLRKPNKGANRRRTDPVVTLSIALEAILNEMRDLPEAQPFWHPVSAKAVPDYHKIVTIPMDLQRIREKLHEKRYQSREEFLADVNQIVENSKLYNGLKSTLTQAAQNMLELCLKRFAEKEDKLMRLEKAINPLLDDDDQVALSYILEGIVCDNLKSIPESWPFHKPVNKKFVKDYYNVIKNPIDLDSIVKNIKAHKYHNREDFFYDVELLYKNSMQFNGAESQFTQKAKEIVEACQLALELHDGQLTPLEQAIKVAQEAALEAADTDSVVTGNSYPAEDSTLAESDLARAED
ncbi:transcription initiation factor tfii-D, putative, partial [Ixodes scapularis]